MDITIIGASAGVGLKTVERALERGHRITTLSRSVGSLPLGSNLTVIKGSATNIEDLKRSLEKTNAVIVTLGTGNSIKSTTLYTDFVTALLLTQMELNLKIPFIILTGFGAGDSAAYNGFLMKLFFKFFLKNIYKNKTEMEEMIAKTDMNWEIVRPGLLTNQPLSEKYRIETTLYKGINIGSISRSDVADFMVKQAENPTELGKYVSLSNK